MSEDNGDESSAQRFLKGKRKIVELQEGGRVLIGRIRLSQLAQLQKGIPDVAALAAGDPSERVAKRLEDPEALLRMEEFIDQVLMAGVLDPRLHAERTGPNGEDQPTPSDLRWDDRTLLLQEILALSGYSKEAAEKVRPFSKSEG